MSSRKDQKWRLVKSSESMVVAGENVSDVPASLRVANPDFGIVFTDDSTHPVNSINKYAQSSFSDPLCVGGVKTEPVCSQVVSDNTSAVRNELGLETLTIEGLPVLSQIEVPGDTSCQSFMNDHDPLQLDAYKKECLHRLEDEVHVDFQVAAKAENTAFSLSPTPISPPFNSASSFITGDVLNDFTSPLDSLVDIKDNFKSLEHLEATRISSLCDKAETTAPSEIITDISSPTGSLPTISADDVSSSQRKLSTVSSSNQSGSGPVSQNRGKKHKCPICNALLAKGDLPEHIKSHETSIIPQTQRSRRHGITSASKTFPCSECSFTANSTTELSEHLEQHVDEVSGVTKPTSNACQVSPALTVTSSPRYRILVLPKPSIVPSVVTLDDKRSNSGSHSAVPRSTHRANKVEHHGGLPSTEIRAGHSPRSRLKTVPQRQFEELRPHQPHSMDSPDEVLPNRDISPIPTVQSHISLPTEVSVIPLSPSRGISVIHVVPIDASQTSPINITTTQSVRQSNPAFANTPFQSSSNPRSLQMSARLSSPDVSQQLPRHSGHVEPPPNAMARTRNSTSGTIVKSPSRCANLISSSSLSTDLKATSIVEVTPRSLTPTAFSEDVQLISITSSEVEVDSPVLKPLPGLSKDFNSNPSAGSRTAVQSGNTNSIQKSSEVLTSPHFLEANILPTLSTENTLHTGAIASTSTALDQPTSSGDRSKTSPLSSNGKNDIAALDDSDDASVPDDLDDPYDPDLIDTPAYRGDSKNSSDDGGASDSGESTTVDPNYVPPSRERLPVKTPDSVIDAIPFYEQWIRSKFVGADSDPETPRPENDCYICARKFDSLELLKKHREERYAKLKCCKCPFKTVTERLLKGHINRHTRPKPYTCEECGMAFTKRRNYVTHFLAHRGDYHYKCNECNVGFTEYTVYEQHVNRHRNITPFKCVKCNVAFNGRIHLASHRKRVHKRKGNTQCKLCKKHIGKYWIAAHLKRHETKQEKTFLCDQCGQSCKTRYTLSMHVLKHTEERPHVCTWCGAGFKVRSALKRHERSHTGERPYECGVCGKAFAQETPHRLHLRIHTGERPYKCDYCGMTFAQPSPFAVHKRLHTGERPYKCKVCPEAFPSHAAVRNHMQTHANSENGSSRKKKRTRAEMENGEPLTKPKKPAKRKTEVENEENSPLTSKPKKRKRRSKAMVKDESSNSESESTEGPPVAPVQPSRRSCRRTKCTKSVIEEEEENNSK